MSQVILEEADIRLAQWVQQARNGEEVTIVRDNIPVAKIVPLPEEKPEPRRPGFGSGKYALIYMAEDFDAPLEDFKDYM
jgi:antitoxin (DNA-binding transcriptional repressor) of toxin-antitoxin stability system